VRRQGRDRVSQRPGQPDAGRVTRRHSDRLIGFASVTPWSGRKGLHELKRAFDAGLQGFKIHSHLQGFRLSDEIIDPFIELCRQYRPAGLLPHRHADCRRALPTHRARPASSPRRLHRRPHGLERFLVRLHRSRAPCAQYLSETSAHDGGGIAPP